MSHESNEQSAQNEISAPVEAQPAAEAGQAVAVPSEPTQPTPSKPTSKKSAAIGKDAKPAMTERGASKEGSAKGSQVRKSPAKSAKKAAAASKPETAKLEKPTKDKKEPPKKPKLVRDSFTIPEIDYALFETLKQRALAAGTEVKKSELLRAALVTLAKLDDAEFIKTIGFVERIKPGRPKK